MRQHLPPAAGMTPDARLTLSCTADLVALVPYLLGYQPRERLVVVIIDGNRLGVTVSVELSQEPGVDELRRALGDMTGRFADPRLFAAAWSFDDASGVAALQTFLACCPDEEVLDTVVVGDERWWSWFDPSRGGDVASLRCAPAATAAVVAGLRTEPSRQVVVDAIAGPGDDLGLRERHESARKRWSAAPGPEREREATRLQMGHLLASKTVGAAALTDLAVLAGDRDVVQVLWLALDERRAQSALDLWTAVVAQAPDGFEHGALVMVGFCAWLAGNGVLHLAALARLVAQWPPDDAVVMLEALHRDAVHPRDWARIRAQDVPDASW